MSGILEKSFELVIGVWIFLVLAVIFVPCVLFWVANLLICPIVEKVFDQLLQFCDNYYV